MADNNKKNWVTSKKTHESEVPEVAKFSEEQRTSSVPNVGRRGSRKIDPSEMSPPQTDKGTRRPSKSLEYHQLKNTNSEGQLRAESESTGWTSTNPKGLQDALLKNSSSMESLPRQNLPVTDDSGSERKGSASSSTTAGSEKMSKKDSSDKLDSFEKRFDAESLRNVKTMEDLLKIAPKKPIATIPLNEAQAKFGSKNPTINEISNTLFTEAAEPMKGKKAPLRDSMKNLLANEAPSLIDDKGHFFEETHFNTPTSCRCCRGFLWGLGKQGLQCAKCRNVNMETCIARKVKQGKTSEVLPPVSVDQVPSHPKKEKQSQRFLTKMAFLENVILEDYRLQVKFSSFQRDHPLGEAPRIFSKIEELVKENTELSEKAQVLEKEISENSSTDTFLSLTKKIAELVNKLANEHKETEEKGNELIQKISTLREQSPESEELEEVCQEYDEVRRHLSKIESLYETCIELSRFKESLLNSRVTVLESEQKDLYQRISSLEGLKKTTLEGNNIIGNANELIEKWQLAHLEDIKIEESPVPKPTFSIDCYREEEPATSTTKPLSLDEVILNLTSGKQQDIMIYQKNFLLTFQDILTPLQLFEKLVVRYCLTPPVSTDMDTYGDLHERVQAPARLRVLNVIKSMIELGLFGNAPEEQSALRNFVEIVKATNLPRMAETLTQKMTQDSKFITVFGSPPPAVLLPKNENWGCLLDLDPLEFTRQITLLEAQLYKSIEPSEFVNQAWTRPNKEETAPNIINMTKFFNRVSGWVIHTLVSESELKKRIEKMGWFFCVVKHCSTVANYNTMFEILAGLSSTSIFRLKKTWEGINPDYLKLYTEFNKLLEKNYGGLRDLQKSTAICVPYLGVYLTDLVFLNERSKTILENGLINVPKMNKTAEVIRRILDHKSSCNFNFTAIEKAQALLKELPSVEDKDAYAISKQLE